MLYAATWVLEKNQCHGDFSWGFLIENEDFTGFKRDSIENEDLVGYEWDLVGYEWGYHGIEQL